MSSRPYKEHQDSGTEWLGQVPSHWSLRRLGYFFEERREKVSDKEFPALSVTKNGIVPQLETAAKTDDGDNRKGVMTGDFVINSRSDRKGSSGIAEQNGSVSLINIVLKPLPAIRPRFAHYLLRSTAFQEEFYRYGKGIVADLWSTNYSDMKAITLAVPSPDGQTAIAAFLDRETTKIDALIEEQKRLVELLKEKRQAVISHAVTKGLNPDVRMKDTGIEWLGNVPEHWEVCAVAYRYDVALGKMLDEKRITGNHLAPYLRNADVQWGRINTTDLPTMDFVGNDLSRYSLKHGDLLVCEGGEVGRAAVWRGELEECYYQKALHRLRPVSDRDSAEFFFYVLSNAANTGVFLASEGKSTIAHLTAEALRRYRFGFPPLDEQLRIAEFLMMQMRKFDDLVSEAELNISLLQERRAALISAAVTGKIDVRELVEAQEAAE